MPRDFLKLHFIIILWGFTAVLGKLIDLPAVQLVAWRTFIAAVALFLMLRNRARVRRRDAIIFVATGMLIGVHWILFFLSVKVANVSICMVGMATISLWTALLEPVMIRERRLSVLDIFFGVIVIAAVGFIFRSELEHTRGFLIAIGSALAATVFSIINGTFAKRFHHRAIALYEMAGACLFCVICLPLAGVLEGSAPTGTFASDDLAFLLILALLCTVYCYSEYVELLNRLSVFTINFANNLEPVYGIVLGALILRDYQQLSGGFYIGAAIILAAVIAYPLLNRYLQKRNSADRL